MEQTINKRFIRFSSKIPFPTELKLGQDITVAVEGHIYVFNVVKQQINDKQDGTVNVTNICKSLVE